MESVEAILLKNLEKWCREQRELMVRANEMMKAGAMHSGSSRDGYTWIDETKARIEENERHIADLDATLADVASWRP